MLEKDIENLIANHPDKFFPNAGFTLIGQQVKLGRCYADIIFEDKYKRKIIVEVKRGTLSREASGQVTEYYGLLKSQENDAFVELILCANIIPSERKRFLEDVGIECKELGVGLINRVAQEVSYSFIRSQKEVAPVILKEVHEENPIPPAEKVWLFQANPKRYDIVTSLSDEEIGNNIHWLVNQHKNDIKAGHLGLIWLSGNDGGIYAITQILTDPEYLEEPDAERKYWADDADKEGAKLRVKMRVIKSLLHNPVTRDTVKASDTLSGLRVLKQPQGTNYLVSSEEWTEIQSLVNN